MKTKKNAGLFHKVNPKWEKLLEICRPKEKGDHYIVDETTEGIKTPVIEGVARINSKGKGPEWYLNLAKELLDKSDSLETEGKLKESFQFRHRAYYVADVGSHVAYYHNAKKAKMKLPSKDIKDMFSLVDKKLMAIRERAFTKMMAMGYKHKDFDASDAKKGIEVSQIEIPKKEVTKKSSKKRDKLQKIVDEIIIVYKDKQKIDSEIKGLQGDIEAIKDAIDKGANPRLVPTLKVDLEEKEKEISPLVEKSKKYDSMLNQVKKLREKLEASGVKGLPLFE